MMRRMFLRPILALLGLLAPACVWAADGPVLPAGLSAIGDIRIVGADGEASWADAGFGKLRFGGAADGDLRLKPRLAEGELIWQPRIGWAVSGTIVAGAQSGQEHAVDLIEAFATWKPMPRGGTRVSARAGLMWPPVSLEH